MAIQPRRITPEQEAAIKRSLSAWRLRQGKCRVLVSSTVGDTETRVFGLQIRNLLAECGFDSTVDGLVIPSEPDFGLFLGVKDELHPPPGAVEILNAFKDARVVVNPFADSHNPNGSQGVPDDALKIIVGVKPFPTPK